MVQSQHRRHERQPVRAGTFDLMRCQGADGADEEILTLFGVTLESDSQTEVRRFGAATSRRDRERIVRRLDYYVYFMTNRSGTLYVGITNDLERRLAEHQSRESPGFTANYKMSKLLYFEHHTSAREALERESELKSWRRSRKIALIKTTNPQFRSLEEDFRNR